MSCTSPNEKPYDSDESSIFETNDIKTIRILKNNADVKSGAGNNYNNIGTLKTDDTADVLGTVGDWFVVRLDDNRVGCVNAADAKPIVKEIPQWNNDPQYGRQTPSPEQETTPDTPEDALPGADQETTPDTVRRNPPVGGPQQPIDYTPSPPMGGAPTREGNQENQENQENQGNQIAQLSSQEQEMVSLVNSERSKNNLPALQADLEVARVARIKSQDMIDNNYFSHNSPNYGSPFDMMKSFGIQYLHAGENLAGNSSVQNAHEALMNSSGHRKNILSADYTLIGIGIKPSDKYGYMFTQMFISKPK